MRFVLYNRDFTEMAIQPDVDFAIEMYSFSTFGGPKTATITATGSKDQLFSLMNFIRCPVEIINDLGDMVWWGYLHELSINWKKLTFGLSIDSMYNNVAIAYTDANIRFTTAYSGDAESIAEYGQKELLGTIADATATDALQRRDTILAGCKSPITTIQGGSGAAGSVRMTCRGWLNTLDWRYLTNLTGTESYETMGEGQREVGEDDRPKIAQSFQIASPTIWVASSVWISIWKVGTPTDNLVVTIRSDNAGNPGAILATASKAGADIGTESEWLEFVLSVGVILAPATTYWIHIERDGAFVFEDADFYMVSLNIDAGYPRGLLKIYNTNIAAWAEEPAYAGDMNFKLVGETETTAQISVLVASCGEFLQGVIIENASGITTNPYKNGDSTALYELESLLLTGTSNSRRLLCEVTQNRYLRIYEEPVEPDEKDSRAIDENGQLLTRYMTAEEPTHCMVGVWAHLAEVIPSTVDLSQVTNPNLFLIEEALYSLTDGYQIIATRNQADVFGIGGTVQG